MVSLGNLKVFIGERVIEWLEILRIKVKGKINI